MKVICVDNYDRDQFPDQLVAGPGLTPAEAQKICDEKNAKASEHGPDFYRVEQDSYQLRDFTP